MKIPLIICFLFIVGLKINGQYIDNKVDIFLGGGISIPVVLNFDGNYAYPSLFENFKESFFLNAGINYWYKKNLSFGFVFEETKYEQWVGNYDVFILKNPKLRIETIGVNACFYPGFINHFKIPGKIGFQAGPELSLYSLRWNDYTYDANPFTYSEDVLNEYLISPGVQIGLTYQRQINLNAGVKVDLSYKLHQTPGLHFLDKSFSSVNLSVKLFIRAFKNRLYNYV